MATVSGTPQPTQPTGFRSIRRQLAAALAQSGLGDQQPGPSLEAQRQQTADPPRLANATLLEPPDMRARAVTGATEAGFSAFLDGIQASRVLLYDAAIPIVHGAVAAVIRIRDERRLTTWDYVNAARIYAPRGFLSSGTNATLDNSGIEIVDTTPRRHDKEIDEEGRHPLLLSDIAVNAVQAHRESLELRLAESWCEKESGSTLFVDGGISSSPILAGSRSAVGVIKSHRTLYGDAGSVRTILALGASQRSSVFLVDSPNRWRSPVASWYLRLRDHEAHHPLWGLVRVEMANPAGNDSRTLGLRADEISRWILAEATPLALPDGRWDTMVYGIRDCEQFLRSLH